MKANETKVNDFLSQNKTRFVIPVYQRNYDWSTLQCKQLLSDVISIARNTKSNAHFIGSIVYVHDDLYTSTQVKELTVIDGQQRLTTLTLIYLAIYNLAKCMNDQELASEISETYLINKFAAEEEKLKLRPTENNDKAIKYLLRGDADEEFASFSKLVDNFNYFKQEICEANYKLVLMGLTKLMFVEISLDREKDDPQRIFESLNSTGLELSQADLIRNYILMGLNRTDQTKIYEHYWEIIEALAKDERTNTSKVSDFIRDYLTLENKSIPNKGKVYLEFKDKYPIGTFGELETNLMRLKSFAKYYNKLINPKNESDVEIRKQFEQIGRLDINVAYPVLLQVYDDFQKEIIDKQTFIAILELLQSLIWRRFILGLPTSSLSKIFINVFDNFDKNKYLHSIQKALLQRTGMQRFPKDLETIEALKFKDLYNIQSKNKTYFFERLENHNNKEPVLIEGNPDITIEHIFPQNPDLKWKLNIGDKEYALIKDKYLNTISNLTLSGNNGKLGNKPFQEKRDMPSAGYKDSRLWLNKYLGTLEKWDSFEIEKRFEIIRDRFLKIWQFPDLHLDEEVGTEEISIFDADDPTNRKLEYAVFFGEKLEVNQVSKLYVDVMKKLFDLAPETFFSSNLGEKIGLVKKTQSGNLRAPFAINDTYYIESNLNNAEKFNRMQQALTEFDFEDELLIKYSK
nr:DUF262 domain-containing protein [uncultured Undibacterium sp.]